MARIFITFGDEEYSKTRDFCVWAARFLGGFDRTIAYSPNDIGDEFIKDHHDIFQYKRGYGLWLWKPYLIYKTLKDVCVDGDYLFYGDGGSFFIRNIEIIEKTMDDNDLWVSHNSLVEWQFTKADTFDIMNCHGKRFEETAQTKFT